VPNSISAGAAPQTLPEELRALRQISSWNLNLSPTSGEEKGKARKVMGLRTALSEAGLSQFTFCLRH